MRYVEQNATELIAQCHSSKQKVDRCTRQYYKDKQKRKAQQLILKVCSATNLPVAGGNDAFRRFCNFRQNREKIMGFEKTIAACIIAAWKSIQSTNRTYQQSVQTANGPQGMIFQCSTCDCKFGCRKDLKWHTCNGEGPPTKRVKLLSAE